MKYDGINRLGRVMQNRMGELATHESVIDFGTIRRDLALIPDGCEDVIVPKGEYSVMQRHREWNPDSGDRVVIAWVGSEIVVLGKIGG